MNKRNNKYIVSILLVFIIISSSFNQVFADINFSDIKETDWYYNNIKELTDLKIINGYDDGEFKPNRSIRANEFVKMLLCVIGKAPEDISGKKWDEAYIKMLESLKLNDKNIIQYSGDMFCQDFMFSSNYYYHDNATVNKQKIIEDFDGAITREQVAAIISNVFALNNIQSFHAEADEYIECSRYGANYYDSCIEDMEVTQYVKGFGLDKIYYNPMVKKDYIIEDKTFKYSKKPNFSFYSNGTRKNGYNSYTCFMCLNSVDYCNSFNYFPYLIKDFDNINELYKYDVIDMYLLGIMQGDSYGNFKPKSSLTRAEAGTVLLRIYDESRRLPLNLGNCRTIDFYNINTCKDDILYAPSMKGKPVNELVEVYDIINAQKEKTLGFDRLGASKSGVYAYGFETQKNLDDYEDFEIDYNSNWSLFEHLNSLKNYDISVNFDEIYSKYDPYEIRINSIINLVEDKEFEGIVLEEREDRYIVEYPKKFDEYFVKYHYELFYSLFEYWFEDEVDVAWNLLMKALVQEKISYEREKNVVSVNQVINNRYVNMVYNDYFINISISLKGSWK